MKRRSIYTVIFADERRLGPLRVQQPLPSQRLDYLDPFVLLHHLPPMGLTNHGVDAHPHRGFSPVSFVFSGGVRHRDSRGNDATVLAGGTQWMHAGSGILHEEMPVAGDLELVQLWINSPARHKMDPPSYHPLTREETPRVLLDNGMATLNVVSGNLEGVAGPIPSLTSINAATVYAKRGARLLVRLPETHNAFLYLLDGAFSLYDGQGAGELHMVQFNNDGEGIDVVADEDTRALLMSGEPIGESIVSHGPFVMNSQDEIRAAYRDYRSGLMGELDPLP